MKDESKNTENTNGLGEILEQLQFEHNYSDNREPYLNYQRYKAQAQILQQVLEMLPEKKGQTKYMGKRHSLIQGYNNAIDEMTAKFKQWGNPSKEE